MFCRLAPVLRWTIAASCLPISAPMSSSWSRLAAIRCGPCRRSWRVARAAYFAWLNTNKRSVTETPAALELLLVGADVLLDGRCYDGPVPEGVSVSRLSWFGEHGPYAGFAGTDAIARALGGLVALTGRADGPPTLATDHQSSIVAGIAAFIATAAGLFDRQNGSRRFSVSTHEAAVSVAEYEAAVAWDAGASRRRPG